MNAHGRRLNNDTLYTNIFQQRTPHKRAPAGGGEAGREAGRRAGTAGTAGTARTAGSTEKTSGRIGRVAKGGGKGSPFDTDLHSTPISFQ